MGCLGRSIIQRIPIACLVDSDPHTSLSLFDSRDDIDQVGSVEPIPVTAADELGAIEGTRRLVHPKKEVNRDLFSGIGEFVGENSL